jgi:hypothetical protein
MDGPGPVIYQAPAPAGLIDAITSVPNMPKALCIPEHKLFDQAVTDPLAAQLAQQCCRYCPHLTQCRDWVASLAPQDRPPRVVGGMISKPTRRYAMSAMTPAVRSMTPGMLARRAKLESRRKAG